MPGKALTTALNQLSIEANYNAYIAVATALDTANADNSGLDPLRVAVLRNFTFDPLLPIIRGDIALAGFFPIIYQSDFDAIARDVLDPNSALYRFQPEFVIIAQWLETLTPLLVTRFISLSIEQVRAEVERVLSSAEELIVKLREYSKAPILLNNFPLPAYTTLGILDTQSKDSHIHTILKLNQELLQRISKYRDVFLVDYFSLMARVGSAHGIDERYWHMGRAPIGRHALLPFGQEYGKFIRALRGKTRKCLVLDCDNTLWGGIIGEDGIGSIKLGSTYPGSCYQAFQHEILNLHDRGVLLALCSKNNEADVLEVLHNHPETILREEHVATRQINWDDKVTNLKRIAQSLNIGLDTLVFVDDNQFECNFVREQLPQVTVVQLPADPSAFAATLSTGAYFDSLIFSAEDRERNQMYRDESQRNQLFEKATSLDIYLANLEMVAEIGHPDEIAIARVSQLTQKTNQFNLTTYRYSEGDIRSFAEGADSDVFYLRLRDRISDLGLIGVAIVKYNGTQAEIDSFLLSCRAIGRGAEEALLAHVFTAAKLRGCTRIRGKFIPTKKNNLAADFYRQQKFKLIAESIQGSDWERSLKKENISVPKWITVKLIP